MTSNDIIKYKVVGFDNNKYVKLQQNAILESKQLPWFYTILNYLLGFVAFAITVFIIYQAFQLLLKPEDDATYKNLRKYFVYSLI